MKKIKIGDTEFEVDEAELLKQLGVTLTPAKPVEKKVTTPVTTVIKDDDEDVETDVHGADTRTVPYSRLAEMAKQRNEARKIALEAQEWKQKHDDLAQQYESEKLSHTRERIAVKKGISIEMASRLVGTNEAELEADADNLLTILNPAASKQKTGVPITPNGKTSTMDINSMGSLDEILKNQDALMSQK